MGSLRPRLIDNPTASKTIVGMVINDVIFGVNGGLDRIDVKENRGARDNIGVFILLDAKDLMTGKINSA
jgi:hypothetical protein